MFGISFTLGLTVGFEFIDENFEGGGWVLHLFFLKVLYFVGEEDE
jgi:hypothetical protein